MKRAFKPKPNVAMEIMRFVRVVVRVKFHCACVSEALIFTRVQ